MAFSAQDMVSSSVALAAFIDQFGNTLPMTVKIVDGFCGSNEDDTLEPDQMFVFQKLEREKVIIALDEFHQQICIQENSNTKVYVLPPKCSTFNVVQELTTAQSPFILVLEDIRSPAIVSGSKLKLLRGGRSVPNHLKCQVVSQDEFRDVILPLDLKGKFVPLLDPSDYYLHEVLAHNQLPVNVRFHSDSFKANDPFTKQSLTQLGNVLLVDKREVTMVFAAWFDNNELSMYVFPRTLNITVSFGFDDSTEISSEVKECKRLLQESEISVKQLDNVAKASFYFTARPIRRFLVQLPPKPFPILRSKHALMRDNADPAHIRSLPRKKPLWKRSADAEEYEAGSASEPFTESRGVDKVSEYSSSPEIIHKVICGNELNANSEVPALPPKTRSYSGGDNEGETAKSYSFPSPVPKSKTLSSDSQVVEAQLLWGNDDECIKSAQRAGKPETEDHIDESCPELPPKPIFLQQLATVNEQTEDPLSQDSPPSLPPRKDMDNCYVDFIENEGNELAYKVVDVVRNWKWYEDRFAYTEIEDICESAPKESSVGKEQKGDGESTSDIGKHQRAEKVGIEMKHAQTNFEEETEDDGQYEEMDTWIASSSTEEFRFKKDTDIQKKELIVPSTNPYTTNTKGHEVKSSGQASQEKRPAASLRPLKKQLIISKPRDDDFLDFKDIEQFFKLRKELNDTRDYVKDLEKKIAVKEECPTDRSCVLSDTDEGMISSGRFGCVGDESNSTDENSTTFISVMTLKRNSESRNVGLAEVGTGANTKKETESPISPVNLPSKSEATVQGQKIGSPIVLKSHDGDDVYTECFKREYSHLENNSAYYKPIAEQGGQKAKQGIEPVFYNTVEVGTSRYLQLEYSSEEDEHDFVNVSAEACNQEAEWGTAENPPPLPPKGGRAQIFKYQTRNQEHVC